MAVKDVGTNWDRDTRNTIDENDKNLQRQINDLVLGSGDSNAEVVQARGGFPVLGSRLDNMQQQINDIVVGGGDSNPEVVQARGGFPVLNERLNNIENNIKDLEKKPSVNPYQDDGFAYEVSYENDLPFKGGVGLNTNDGSETENASRITYDYIELEQGTEFSIKPKNGSRYFLIRYDENRNIQYTRNWSTSEHHETFNPDGTSPGYIRLILSYTDDRVPSEYNPQNHIRMVIRVKKEVNYPNVINTGSINPKNIKFRVGSGSSFDGSESFTSTRITSNYVYIKNSVLSLDPGNNKKFFILLYDENSNYLGYRGWITNKEKLEVNNLDYIKVQNLGNVTFARFLVAYRDDRELTEDDIPNLSIVVNDIESIYNELFLVEDSDVIDVDSVHFKIGSGNLYDGSETTTNTRIISDYIKLKNASITIKPIPNSKYIVLFYDANMNYQGYRNWTYNERRIVIDTTSYVRIIVAYEDDRELTEDDIPQLSKVLNEIEAYKPVERKNTTDDYYFRSEDIPSIPIGEDALGYEDFMNQTWETLRSNYSDYISRDTIIKDQSGTFDIYEYVFEPDNYEKTAFLISGVHGDEYEGFWGLYYFMKNLCENSYKHKQLRDLKHKVRFVVIPVLNPWGVENRTRATSRVSDVNHNYDVFFDATEYETKGTHGFSENESRAVEILADKYDGEIDYFADIHTDPYIPENGNYITANQLSSTFEVAKDLTFDEADNLKDKYGFGTEFKPLIVNTNRRASSFKYMEAVRGIPSNIIEVSTGDLSPIGSSTSITIGVDWFTNVIAEMLKHDLTKPKQIENGLEKSISEGRITGYVNSVNNKIADRGLQVYLDSKDFNGSDWSNKAERGEVVLDGFSSESLTEQGVKFDNSRITLPVNQYSDFTLVFKGIINGDGAILGSESDELRLLAYPGDDSTKYRISNGSSLLTCSILEYGRELTIGIKSENGRLYLYVNGEPFNSVASIHSTEDQLYIGSKFNLTNAIDMSLKSLALYDRALKDDEIGFVFKNFLGK